MRKGIDAWRRHGGTLPSLLYIAWRVGHVTCHTIPKKKEKRTRVPTGHRVDSLPTQGFRVLSHSFLFSLKSLLISHLTAASSFSASVQYFLDMWFFGSRFGGVADAAHFRVEGRHFWMKEMEREWRNGRWRRRRLV